MTCERARLLAALAVSDDLNGTEKGDLDRHLSSCGACRLFARQVAATREDLGAMAEEPVTPEIYTALRARVLARIGTRERAGFRLWWTGAAVAALVLAVLVVDARHQPPLTHDVPRPARPAEVHASYPPLAQIDTKPQRSPLHRRRPRTQLARIKTNEPPAEMVMKILTSDPDVVIYWIAETGESR